MRKNIHGKDIRPVHTIIIVMVIGILMGMSIHPRQVSCTPGEKGQGSWWVHVYGALGETDHPMVGRVQRVFQKVLAAADKRSNRFPHLIILRGARNPWAICLKDGNVILTQKAMEFCYRGVSLNVGDARIAFVLGHELAHLAKDDFWHLAAFDTIQRFSKNPENARETLKLLRRTEDLDDTPHARDIARKKEMQADAYGLLYASMAGFDPKIIVNEKGNNFIKAWADQLTGLTSKDAGVHPDPAQRAEFLLTNMRSVKSDLALFHLGIRLYQIGRYQDALDFLSAFHRKFPSREVFNNLGLLHYQIAMEQLAVYAPERAVRFHLATMVDLKTRAEQYRGGCSATLFGKALRFFRAACEMDPTYLPSRVNHASALIMAQRYSEALAVLDEAMAPHRNHPSLLNNRAVALYLMAPSIGTDLYRQAVTLFKQIMAENPEFAPAYFNLARLQTERERHAGARNNWRRYLALHPGGRYGDTARKIMGMGKYQAENQNGMKGMPSFLPPPFLLPGSLEPENQERLVDGLIRHRLNPFTACGDYYSNHNTMVLVLEDVVELVEQKTTLDARKNLQALGKPNRILTALSGTKSYVYDQFVIDVDVTGKTITRVVYFSEKYN